MNADEPLTPEERALAERLRLGRPALPSAALDAAILAAARAAVAPAPAAVPQGDARSEPDAGAGADAVQPAPIAAAPQPARATPSTVVRRRTRWPAWTGLAASLTLAVGIAWQLRTPPPPVPMPAAAPAHAPIADAMRFASAEAVQGFKPPIS